MGDVFGGLDPAVYIGDMSKDPKKAGNTPLLAAVLGHAQAAFGKDDIFRKPEEKPQPAGDKDRRQAAAPKPDPPQREASLFGPQTSVEAMDTYMPAAMPQEAKDVQGLMEQYQAEVQNGGNRHAATPV